MYPPLLAFMKFPASCKNSVAMTAPITAPVLLKPDKSIRSNAHTFLEFHRPHDMIIGDHRKRKKENAARTNEVLFNMGVGS